MKMQLMKWGIIFLVISSKCFAASVSYVNQAENADPAISLVETLTLEKVEDRMIISGCLFEKRLQSIVTESCQIYGNTNGYSADEIRDMEHSFENGRTIDLGVNTAIFFLSIYAGNRVGMRIKKDILSGAKIAGAEFGRLSKAETKAYLLTLRKGFEAPGKHSTTGFGIGGLLAFGKSYFFDVDGNFKRMLVEIQKKGDFSFTSEDQHISLETPQNIISLRSDISKMLNAGASD